ncbi:MAG: nitroreductase family protein [Atopobiaceae bacterium]|jgi:hypothetical protein|nr:nitroreductase [Atopobiaceae bacterium]MCH4181223.1 nitroreductase [Atopobiaceae bacterium]MCH4214645.1 nitroreductase [Atopobiaceae bacterium]MCH4230148.1 nitroreductase [Atopobiaceae bacterium]MCH4275760.1 nitroreductase [Atopobiaceae bacterium]
MDQIELMRSRHAVRHYLDHPIEAEKRVALQGCVDACNQEGSLHLQLAFDEPEAFTSGMAHYGSFAGVTDYLALIGRKSTDLEERVGFHGERVVLLAQELGLNTCWVVLTYGKRSVKADIEAGEQLVGVIAMGYGETQGIAHKSKPAERLYEMPADAPDWYRRGIEGATLAPTAMNQQRFHITLDGDVARVARGMGPNTKTDLGIVRHDFEAASGHGLEA